MTRDYELVQVLTIWRASHIEALNASAVVGLDGQRRITSEQVVKGIEDVARCELAIISLWDRCNSSEEFHAEMARQFELLN